MEVGVCAIVRRDQGKPSPQNPNTSQIIKLRRKLKVNRMHVINSLESCQDGLKHKRITGQEKARNRIRARTHKGFPSWGKVCMYVCMYVCNCVNAPYCALMT
uniref:Uncharacterized protein n=1 Tax=Helianthus annuus TaxID=4232 RepID=A0A251UAE3_HELAN